MAITFDISIIEEKIKKLSSKEERLNYLNRLLFDWDKVRIEFNTYDKAELKRLKDVTKDDYKAYKNEFDNGRLVYFDNGKFEKVIAERIGIKNLELLKKRLRLEFRKDDIKAKISILENLIKREQNKNTPSKLDFTKEKLNRLVIELSTLNGYDKPSTYLNEILGSVKQLNDTDFEFSFFLNMFHSFKDNAGKFWSEAHKQDISEWFNNCPYPAHLAGKDENKSLFDTLWENTPPPVETEQETVEIKPVLKPEAVQTVFDILKDFFSTEQQSELKQLLETGNNTGKHLIFLDNGNRLADAFKQLKNKDIITGCDKKELEIWIGKNFKFRYRKEIREYKPHYLNDIISTNKDKCQNPLLNVTTERATGVIKITKA